MAGPSYVSDLPFVAEAAITKYTMVKPGSAAGTVVMAAAATDAIIGICQNDVTAADATNGRVVDVRVAGSSRALVGTTVIAEGQLLTSDTLGRCISTGGTAGNRYIGIALTAKAAAKTGEHVDVIVSLGGS